MSIGHPREHDWLKRMVEELDNYCWRVVRPPVLGVDFRDEMHAIESGPWSAALAHYVGGYAFTWATAPAAWGRLAREIILDRGKSSEPTSAYASDCWSEFQGHVDGTNPGLNPLNCDREHRPVTEFVGTLTADKYNIVRWAARVYREGDARLAYRQLGALQGVGPKIASFFLRDVVAGLRIPEGSRKERFYIQPIDVWVERGVQALDRSGHEPTRGKDKYLRQRAVAIADELDVKSGQLNTALFVLGAKFAKTPDRMEEGLRNPSVLSELANDRLAHAPTERPYLRRIINLS